MKKVLSIILAALMLAALGVTAFADTVGPVDDTAQCPNSDDTDFGGIGELTAGVTAEFTVLESSYSEDYDSYGMIVSYRKFAYQTYGESYAWYYTTMGANYKIGDEEVTVGSDGSEIGNAALESFKNKRPVPAGTVVRLSWNGEIMESYPPQFGGKIYGIEFTGETTEYTLDEMEQALGGYYGYDGPAEIPPEGVRCAYKADFTVAGCDTSTLVDGRSTKSGSTLYLLQNGAYQNFVRLRVDVDKFAVLCGEGDDNLTETYKSFLKTGELPVGTVVSISWSGLIAESYPEQFEGVFGLTVTSKKTDYSEADLKAETDAFYEEFSGSTQGDYPAMIFYNGVLYKLADSALELPQDVDFASLGTLSYVEGEPTVSGTQNYSLDPVDFAEAVYNGVDCLVARCDGDFRFFLPYGVTVPELEGQSYQSVPNPGALNPEYKNPETGTEGGALAVTALAAAVCAIMLRKRGEEAKK